MTNVPPWVNDHVIHVRKNFEIESSRLAAAQEAVRWAECHAEADIAMEILTLNEALHNLDRERAGLAERKYVLEVVMERGGEEWDGASHTD